MFMPTGAPMALAPFLVIVELVSYFIKALTLGVRLVANLTAGHLLFAIIAGST
jgi:F0F1-type ATP synthase membrane subunit a